MSTKHTPGPWRSALVSDKSWHVGVYDNTGTQVALVKVASALSAPRRDADARLIAAAPELLEALKAAFDLMVQEDFGTLTLVPKLRAAIAKATGEAA